MSNGKAVGIAIIFAILYVTASDEINRRSIENENSQSVRAVANSVNQFSRDFNEVIFKDGSQDNMVCSTLSVAMVLMMAAYGAGGKTLEEMNEVLYMNSDETMQKNGIHSLISQFNAVKKVQLHLANKIYIPSGWEINPIFKMLTDSTFQSETENLNFSNSVEACQKINSWCEEQTNSRIKNIVQENELDDNTAMVLINAVYFKGNWARKFNESNTKLGTFYLSDNTSKQVPMMHDLGKYRYGYLPQLSAKFIELPYESDDTSDAVSMIIILPNEINGLKKVEENLHKVNLTQLLTGDMYEVDLSMPKFKIESKIDLKSPLSSLGLQEIFGTNANFSRIMHQPPLKVTKIVQKAFIEVNEEGSEAAAVTGFQISTFSMPIQTEFHIDHPFYYSIVKLEVDGDNSGVILFQGHCVDIEERI